MRMSRGGRGCGRGQRGREVKKVRMHASGMKGGWGEMRSTEMGGRGIHSTTIAAYRGALGSGRVA
jgi:hypothetical protein